MALRYRSKRTAAPAGQYLIGGLLTHNSKGELDPKPLAVSKRAPKNSHDEHWEQSAFYTHIHLNKRRAPELLRFRAIPNGGYRGERVEYRRKDGSVGDYNPVGQKLLAEGVKAGTLDNLCTVARRGYHSLWIEFKVNNNKLSEAQEEERQLLVEEGHCVHTVWTWVEAWHIAVWYLELDTSLLQMPSRVAIFEDLCVHDERCGCGYLKVKELPSWPKKDLGVASEPEARKAA